jgi:hypothetical protein
MLCRLSHWLEYTFCLFVGEPGQIEDGTSGCAFAHQAISGRKTEISGFPRRFQNVQPFP